ncbi:MAG: hypothetical protein H7281_08595 [Bacteriovorax sp.]|nr:hypothetical protein [Bacteriovorax sp.]
MKKNLNLKRTGIILISLFFSVSCKLSQKIENINTGSQIGNMTFSKERPFIQSELVIGRRICAALKKKREFIQGRYDRQDKFKFQGSIVNCQGITTLDSSFEAFIIGSSLQYLDSAVSPRENYFNDIITDQSIAMNDICLSLAVSDNVSNSFKTSSLRYTVNFLIAENYDRYEVLKELSDSKGAFSIAGAEGISVITQTTQAEFKFFGVEKERVRNTICDGKKIQVMKQSWTGSLTPF